MSDNYNHDLCVEKHAVIDKVFKFFETKFNNYDTRIKKVENRFLAIMSVLVMNLLGIIGTLCVMLLKHG